MNGVARGSVAVVVAGALLSGCATVPHGPSVMVLPGSSEELRAIPGRRRGLPPVGLAAGRHHGADKTVDG